MNALPFLFQSTISSVRRAQPLAKLAQLEIPVPKKPDSTSKPPHEAAIARQNVPRRTVFPGVSSGTVLFLFFFFFFGWEAHPLAHASAQIIAQVGVSFLADRGVTPFPKQQQQPFNPGREHTAHFHQTKRGFLVHVQEISW